MLIEKLSAYLVQSSVTVYVLLVFCILAILLAGTIASRVYKADDEVRPRDFLINVIRGFSVLLIGLLGYFRFYGSGQSVQGTGIKLLSIFVVIYFSYLAIYLLSRFVRIRYGRRVQNSASHRIADTYASRALSISISVFIGVMALISIIRIAGFSSLLEAGGVIGFIGVFLALTQTAWAPDIISGLIILNSKMFEERDVIKLSEGNDSMLAVVYRTRAFHTELLNVVDNHRIMIRNSKVRDYTVHNLSKFASARGLRETMLFKIGYDVDPKNVATLFEQSFELAVQDDQIAIEEQYPIEVRLKDAGDHAVEWSVHYYTKDANSMVRTRQLFRQIILQQSIELGISLSTPIMHKSV